MKLHKGNLNAVVFGKKLEAKHKEAIVWDVEKGSIGMPGQGVANL